jgi:acetoin utilization deacetylase AcuC-like enzyme
MIQASPPVLLADDELFLQHVAPADHPERPERLLAVRRGLAAAAGQRTDAYMRLSPRDGSDDELARVHEPRYVEALGHLAGRSGYLDSDTYLSPQSVAAAKRAAGACSALVDALLAGQSRFGLATPRPPGHHALADRAMGFCLLNNIAIAAAHARAHGRERVLVLDWDVHHGNGTEAMFYEDPSVLFVSLHQFPNYPGTGAWSDVGSAAGRGSTVNLPLPPRGDDATYAAAFERVVLPVVEQFSPALTLVSCGFDAHQRDPLAEMELSAQGYGYMTERLIAALPPACPLGVVLEGGYDLEALTASSQAVAEVLLGAGSASERRITPHAEGEHQAALAQIERAQKQFWKLA